MNLTPNMKVEEHTQGVGAIVTNLLALETVLRYFLLAATGQTPEFPNQGETHTSINYLTAYKSLGPLIKLYNEKLTEAEKKYEVNLEIVKIRDAFAHGRLVAIGELPYTLWKFGEAINTKVAVDFCETLTADWLKKTWLMIDGERGKIVECFKARGYKGLS